MEATYVIGVGVADVRRDPDPDSEQVTQALMNAPARAGETSGEWTHVQLSDYEGWVRTDQLAEPIVKGFTKVGDACSTPLDLIALITVPQTSLYVNATGEETLDIIYLSTVLPLLDSSQEQRLQVALPGERSGWVTRQDVSIRRSADARAQASIREVITYARSLLDRPYLWGGTTAKGIDCSGFVQLCYRMGGSIIPRDADQQHDALTRSVPRKEMQEGDLIFFGSKSITHVGMALNNKEYIHAAGGGKGVIINSFDPTDEQYDQHLLDIVWGVKRVVS